MFHFWFNTFFVVDAETATLDHDDAADDEAASAAAEPSVKMSVSRTQSDQTRVIDRIVAEQRRLRKQLNVEIRARARRADSSDQLHVSDSPSSGMFRIKSDSRLARQQQPTAAAATQFYGNDAASAGTPRPRTYKVLRLEKSDIDRANKDRLHRLFPSDFAVRCYCRCYYMLMYKTAVYTLVNGGITHRKQQI